MQDFIKIGNKKIEFIFEGNTEKGKIILDNQTFDFETIYLNNNRIILNLNNSKKVLFFYKDEKNLSLHFENKKIQVITSDMESEALSTFEEKGSLTSPMPGKIIKIFVKIGDYVKKGDVVAIVEAMKMENKIISPDDGRVKAINFKELDQVDTNQPIIELDIQNENREEK